MNLIQLLTQLANWEDRHLPGNNRSAGKFLLVWLCTDARESRPLKKLYGASPFSEKICREAVRAFTQGHYISLTSSDHDKRKTMIVPTPKLVNVARRYMALFSTAFRDAKP